MTHTTESEQAYTVRKYVKRTKPMQYGAAHCAKQRNSGSNKTLALMFNSSTSIMRKGLQRVSSAQLPDSDTRDRTLTAALLHRPISEWGDAYRQYKSL